MPSDSPPPCAWVSSPNRRNYRLLLKHLSNVHPRLVLFLEREVTTFLEEITRAEIMLKKRNLRKFLCIIFKSREKDDLRSACRGIPGK